MSYARGDREGLIHAYDEENGGFGLTDLAEDSEDEDKPNGFSSPSGQNHHRHPKSPNQ